MLGTKKIKGKKKEERKDNMEKMLVQILDGLKDIKEEIYIIKEENREEHKAMKQNIVEIKEEQKIIRQEQKEYEEMNYDAIYRRLYELSTIELLKRLFRR